jgi:hypothetical protein
VYGPVRTVVWEDGGREAPSYPIPVPTLRKGYRFKRLLFATAQQRYWFRSTNGRYTNSSDRPRIETV